MRCSVCRPLGGHLIVPRLFQQTPIGPFTGSTIKPKIGLTPVLRAGMGMTDALLDLFPYVPFLSRRAGPTAVARIVAPDVPHHPTQTSPRVPPRHLQGEGVAAARRMYVPHSESRSGARQLCGSRERRGTDYSKLPPNPTVEQVFLLDPLIATGGTACAAMNMIVEWGIPGE